MKILTCEFFLGVADSKPHPTPISIVLAHVTAWWSIGPFRTVVKMVSGDTHYLNMTMNEVHAAMEASK